RRPCAGDAGEAPFDRLAHERRAREADHAQRPAHLVQVLGTGLQHRVVLRRRRILGDRVLDERQSTLDFRVDPGQERGVGHWSKQAPFAGPCYAASLKPATELFRPSASAVSLAAELAVCLVPSVVSCVMPRITFMLAATLVAEAACSRVEAEIDSMSCASCSDTVPISRSAWPASSAVFAPCTTPCVLRSIASTASCVSR